MDKQKYFKNKANLNLGDDTIRIMEMYNRPMQELSGYKGLGGFFDSITSTVKKVAKGAYDAVKDGVDVVKKVTKEASKTIESLPVVGDVYKASPWKLGADIIGGKNIMSSVGNLAKNAVNVAQQYAPYAAMALAPMTGGASLQALPMIQGLTSMMGQSGSPAYSQPQQYAQQYAQSNSPYTYNPYQYMQSYMQNQGISPQQLMYQMPAMQYQMPQYYGMRGGRLGATELRSIATNISNVSNPIATPSLPGLKALETLLNNPQSMFAVLKFQLINPGITPEEALTEHIDVQRAISKIRAGEKPQQVLSLLGRTFGKRNLGALSIPTALSSLSSLSSLTSNNPFAKARTYVTNLFITDKNSSNTDANTDSLWQKVINDLNTASDYNTLLNILSSYSDRYDDDNSGRNNFVENALNTFVSKYNEYLEAQEQATVSAQETAVKTQQLAEQSALMEASDPAKQILAAVNVIDTAVGSVGKLSKILDEIQSSKSENVLSNLTQAKNLLSREEQSLSEQAAALSSKNKISTDQTLSKVVASSAINKLKKDGMSTAASLAEQLSKTKLENIKQQATNVVRDNAQLRANLDKLNKEHSIMLNKYNEAVLNSNEARIKMLERDKDKLTAKLIKAYGLLDTLRNKLHAFRNALQIMMTTMKDSMSQLDYQRLVDLDKDFAEKIALMDSLGIEVAKPEAIDKIWELFSSNLATNPCYIDALTNQTNKMNSLSDRNYSLNSLPNTRPINPLTTQTESPTPINGKRLGKRSMGQAIKPFMITNAPKLCGGQRRDPLPPTRSMLGIGNPVADIISGIMTLLPKGANKYMNGGRGGLGIGQSALISNVSDYPNLNVLVKFILAGNLLQLCKDIIIDDSIRDKFVSGLAYYDNIYRNIAERVSPLIKKYLTGTQNFLTADVGYDHAALSSWVKDLDNLIVELNMFIRKLAWVGSDLLYKVS